jgi:GNAT superfamily N-acetyltransferase
MGVELRRATDADADVVAEVYLTSFKQALPTVKHGHDDESIRGHIRDVIGSGRECWVAVDGAAIVGLMFLKTGWVDQLYVAPDRLGEGIGRRLLDLAKEGSGGELQLWTFQVNARARRFYERNGFEAVELTDGSTNEEHEPDVRYSWHASYAT